MSVSNSIGLVRSWLFAPGDSQHKMGKALASAADIVLIDLEDAVADREKANARLLVAEFLRDNSDHFARLWVRINPIQTDHALKDLASIVPVRPGGIMLPKPRNRGDVEQLDNFLTALEASSDLPLGEIKVIIVATETPEGMFATGSYGGAPRFAAMTWGAEDIATAIGAMDNRCSDGSYDFTYQLARSLCVTGAAVANVPAIETIHGDFRDEKGLIEVATSARRTGFRGMLAIHPAQVDPINAAFSPTAAERTEAQEIVDLFAANPELGTIGHKGAMLDRPHLVRAQAILAMGTHQ